MTVRAMDAARSAGGIRRLVPRSQCASQASRFPLRGRSAIGSWVRCPDVAEVESARSAFEIAQCCCRGRTPTPVSSRNSTERRRASAYLISLHSRHVTLTTPS